MKAKHTTAKSSHYDNDAQHYDAFNEKRSQIINKTIHTILQKYAASTVLDLTCGTGSQLFYLIKHGYQVIGSDINSKMLEIAKNKAKKNNQNIQFIQGDMRTTHAGEFDAVITIFNAIGHLTKKDFEKTIQNINQNLKPGGLYIFDIFNLDYMLHENNITKLTIDWQTINGDIKAREIQYSTIDSDGILASYTILHEEKKSQKPKTTKSVQTLQIYTATELKKMLKQNGFKVVAQTDIDGSKFNTKKTGRILTVAQKVK